MPIDVDIVEPSETGVPVRVSAATAGSPLGSGGSLRSRAVSASLWTMSGYGLGQLLRVGRTLVLTRLLYPEAFGLMALASVFQWGLEMFSDVGVGPAIVRDPRGDEPTFVNTAWTIQALRGGLLWLACCLIAWPVAHFYGEPMLAYLLPVCGMSTLIAGFNSPAIYTAKRHLRLERLTLLELGSQVTFLGVTILWAAIWPSVWALVVGNLVSAAVYLAATHLAFPGTTPRFEWDRSAAHELRRFGKWIFLSSAVFFLAQQGDRLFLGRCLPVAMLGIYSIAVNLAQAIQSVAERLSGQVLYPLLGHVGREQPEKLRSAYYRARHRLDVILVAAGVLLTAGPEIVRLLFDSRYVEAGWILQMFGIRAAMASLAWPAENCLVSQGYPVYCFLRRVAVMGWLFVGIPVGWAVNGLEGVVWATALAEGPALVILTIGLARQRILDPIRELPGLAFLVLGGVLGLGVRVFESWAA